MFDWLLRHVLLRGQSKETIDACLSHPEVRALLRFRFAYLFAFHAPVLLPLLDALSGPDGQGQGGDPSLSVLSLGLASLTMVLADVPTGFYADRHGAKASLRLGLWATSAIMVAFFAMAVVRALWPGPFAALGLGPLSVLVLEAAIGVSLALLSGPDTVLFLQVARRSQIPGLLHPSFEGVGSSIRYLGTMVAVLLGALLYDLCAWMCPSAHLRMALQAGLFLLTAAAELFALYELARITDDHSPLRRPGLRELFGGFAVVLGYPRFFAEMWLLSMAAAVALFAVYLVQSPLSRLATGLATRHPVLWPLYTLVSVGGYWACSVGSQRFARHRGQALDVLPQRSLGLAGGSWGLLLLLPVGYWATQGQSLQPLVVLGLSTVLCLLFNYVRGFIEPYSAATLIRFTQEHCAQVPASVVSGFNSLKRGAHFGWSALFFVLQRRFVSRDPDGRLAHSLAFVALGFALVCLPVLPRLWARPGIRPGGEKSR